LHHYVFLLVLEGEIAEGLDFYVFDENKKLVYRGQLDDSRPGNDIPVSGNYIRNVFDCLLSSKEINIKQKPSIGCNIKWIN
jgi:hypothetical protein